MTLKDYISIGSIVLIMLIFCGCGNTAPVQTTLYVQETQWSELGSETYDPIVITPLKRGDVVYDSHDTKIIIKKVTDDNVVLELDGYMIEPNDDGSINLNAEPVKEIELKIGQSVELASQTMSAGFDLSIHYD